MSQVKITGVESVLKLLQGVGENISGKAARRAVMKGARVVQQAVKSETPRDTGAMQASIGVKTKKSGGKSQGRYSGRRGKIGGKWYAIIGPRRKFERYGKHPTEYVHALHNGHIDASGAYHPGDRFVERAYEKSKRDAEQVVIDEMADSLKF